VVANLKRKFVDRVLPYDVMGEQDNDRIKQMDVKSSMILEDEAGAHLLT